MTIAARRPAPKKARKRRSTCYTGDVFVLSSIGLRYVETGVLAVLVVATVLIFLRSRPAGLVWFSALAMSVVAVHLFMEEGRWQMVPAYTLLTGLAFWIARPARPRDGASVYGGGGLAVRIIVVLIVLPALAVPFLAPIFVVGPGSGPHDVGTARVIVDGPRSSWYPARAPAATAAPYWSADDLRRNRLPGLPLFAATHLTLVPTPATNRAPIAEGEHPVLAVLPDDSSLPGDHLNAVLEAASLGWLVVRFSPDTDEQTLVRALGRLDDPDVDSALAGRVDTGRIVLLVTGGREVPDLGLSSVRLGGDFLLEAVVPAGRFVVDTIDGEVPPQAMTMRYLLAYPSRLVVGSSDIAPSRLDTLVRGAMATILGDGSPDAPVFSGRAPALDGLVASLRGVVQRRLP